MSQHMSPVVTYTLAGVLGLLMVSAGFFAYRTITLEKELAERTGQFNETSAQLSVTQNDLVALQEAFTQTNERLAELTDDLEDTEKDLRREKGKNDEFEDQIESLAGTVGTLDKLSKTDKELLQKYSKVYFLNENYVPSTIRQIDNDFILEGKDIQYFHADALPFLEDMLAEAEDDGIDLKVTSAYRSFDHQTALKGDYTTIYGSGDNAFSADQGYSEHQLGTTVDLTTSSVGGTYPSFADTEAYEWLLDNAHKYGFTLSYPENNNFYVFEPWHWRFVGVDLARDLKRADAHFYDWEQRKIDEYLISVFD